MRIPELLLVGALALAACSPAPATNPGLASPSPAPPLSTIPFGTGEFIRVSMVQLFATPERFDGKRVSAAGWCNLEFEGNALYLHEEDFRHGLVTNALWLDVPHPLPESYKSAHGGYAGVVGTFRAGRGGHFGRYNGSISVEELRRVPSRAELLKER